MAVRTIGTDIKLTGEKEFNDGMKAINSNLKTLRSDMASVSATFEDNADSVEALTSKQKILQDSVDQQRVKVDALRQMYEKVAAASGENSAAADKWKQQLNMATVALAKEEKALRQNNDALDKAKAALKDAEKATEDLDEASKDAAKSADKTADSLDDVSKKADKADSALPGVVNGLGSVASAAIQAGAAIAAVGAGLGTAAITAMVGFAKESAEAAKAAAEAGETLNASQQAWLEYADRLDALEASAAKAKGALGGILLPMLSDLSEEGALYLDNFSRRMQAAAGDSKKQAQVISDYLAKGARLILDNLPEYVEVGRDLLNGIREGFAEVAPELLDEGADLVFDLLESILENGSEMAAGGDALFDKLRARLEERGPDLAYSAVTLLSELIVGLSENAGDLIPVAGSLILALVGGFTDSLPELGTAAGEMIGSLIVYLLYPENLKKVASAAIALGKSIATAIWNGLVALWNQIADIPGLVDGLNAAQQYQMTGTISPVTIPGYADGLDRVPYDNYLARLHKDEMVLTAAEAALYRSGNNRRSSKSGATVNVTFNVKTLNEEDVEMVLDLVDRKLGDDMP